jgi:ubiquinone/menaquinone biosynthesis C-methylase UbiE
MKIYIAKESYQNGSTIEDYLQERFSGLIGKYRYKREQDAVKYILGQIPNNVIIADCPCGNGRWWPLLSKKASKIIAIDISEGMIHYSKEFAKNFDLNIEVRLGDAENLSLSDNSVDYVFSHALTKHLPIPTQFKVLEEFGRIAKLGVICSFGIFSHMSYEFWRRRALFESYPVIPEELHWMAESASLIIQRMRKCTTPIGVEYTVLFKKVGSLL